ncbi:MAG: radical SAM protein [Limisphaerales bacterium]
MNTDCSTPHPAPLRLESHPCFNRDTHHQTARVHLPVAPRCNVQCNFCDRRMDCANEGRPGVTSAVLTPSQALGYLDQLTARTGNLAVVGIAGPGDPMANADATLETLRLVRARYPEMLLCLATNGLELLEHIPALAALRLSDHHRQRHRSGHRETDLRLGPVSPAGPPQRGAGDTDRRTTTRRAQVAQGARDAREGELDHSARRERHPHPGDCARRVGLRRGHHELPAIAARSRNALPRAGPFSPISRTRSRTACWKASRSP